MHNAKNREYASPYSSVKVWLSFYNQPNQIQRIENYCVLAFALLVVHKHTCCPNGNSNSTTAPALIQRKARNYYRHVAGT